MPISECHLIVTSEELIQAGSSLVRLCALPVVGQVQSQALNFCLISTNDIQ